MPGALPIAGVSAGDNLRFGSPTVQNVAWTIAPDGINSGKVSFQNAVYFAGQTGATVWFAFDQPYVLPPTINVAFTFGGDKPLSGVSAGVQTKFGTTALTKAAKDAFPSGIDSAKVSQPKVYYGGANGATVDFPFTAAYTAATPINTPFYFGGNPTVSGVTVGDQTRFGLIQDIRKPLQALPSGFDQGGVGKPRVGVTGSIDFVFNLAYDFKPTALNVPYYFGPGLAISVPGQVYTKFGNTKLTKSALDAFPNGISSLQMGRPTTYFSGQNGAGRDFIFMSPYVKPPTLNVPFYFSGELNPRPYGWFSSQVGEPTIDFRVRYLYPFGYRTHDFGTHYIVNDIEFAIDLATRGINSLAMGQPTLVEADRTIYQINTGAQTGYGTPTVSIKVNQFVTNVGNINATLWGTQRVEHAIRTLYHDAPFAGNFFGTANVGYRVRTIFVPYFVSLQMSEPRVSRNIVISTPGIDSLRMGTPDAILDNVRQMQGWNSLQMSGLDNRISRSPQVANVIQSSESFLYGTPRVFNSRQYVYQLFDPAYEGEGNRGVGKFTWIYNRNRFVGVIGWLSQRFAISHIVDNKARPVGPSSIAPPTFTPPIQIAYRIRYLPLEGIDATWVSRYPAIYNAAYLLRPVGFNALRMGTPSDVSSNQQRIRTHSGWVGVVGEPMIADAIRTIFQDATRNQLRMGLDHRISLFEQFVLPPGIPAPGVGGADVAGPFRKIIAPRWTYRGIPFGEATVRNKIPQAFPQGFDAFGTYYQHKVEFLNRPVTVVIPASTGARVGQHAIRDRKQTVPVQGFNSMRVPTTARVAKEGFDPPSPQLIFVPNDDGSQINYLKPPGLGIPLVQASPRPSGWITTRYGTPSVRGNQIYVGEWPYPDTLFQFGVPSLNRPPTCTVPSLGQQSQFGKPQMSPYTIWARTDAPQQAKDNHDGYDFTHQFLALPVGGIELGPQLPSPTVTLRHRIIYQYHGYTSNVTGAVFGSPSLVLKHRVIAPVSFRSARFGYPELPATVEVLGIGWLSQNLGTAKVENAITAFTRYITGSGFDSKQFGQTQVENFHRPVYPVGYVATIFGNNNPMVYHKPRGPRPTGYIATQWGVPMVAFRIRNVYPEGFDAFGTGRTLGNFNGRMRVFNKTNPTTASGRDSSEFGSASVRTKDIRVYPYQIQAPRCIGEDVTVSLGV